MQELFELGNWPCRLMPLKSGIMPRNYAAIMPKLCRNYAEIMLYYAGIMLLCRNYAFYATRCFYAAIMLLCHDRTYGPTDLAPRILFACFWSHRRLLSLGASRDVCKGIFRQLEWWLHGEHIYCLIGEYCRPIRN